MTIYEEVQLAIDMGIESALEFVLTAKLNYNGPATGYWGFLNGKRVWLSCVSAGKISELEKPGVKNRWPVDNKLLIKEPWDKRTNKAYPKNYFTDEICRINYELKLNSQSIGRLQTTLYKTPNNNRHWINDALTYCYEKEEKLNRKKHFIKNGNKAKSIILSDYKSYPLKDVIESYGLTLIPSGADRYKMCCPLHNEKTPSFFVKSDKNTFKCFGCGEYGDVLDFITKYEKISVIEAAKKLSPDIK